MKNYYEVLGLSEGASHAEIKKAYFKLVRKYTPEKDPETFREIREAYEYLKNVREEKGPSFPRPADPWAGRMLDNILRWEKSGDAEMFRDACEEAVNYYPDEIQFHFLMGVAQRRAGNTGKSVKTFENLVKREPENKWFQRELALSYQERGYTRKAAPAFEKALEMGCRDTDFILSASLSFKELGWYAKAQALLWDLANSERHWSREELPELLDAVAGLIVSSQQTGKQIPECIRLFKNTLKQYSIYLEEYADIIISIMGAVLVGSRKSEDTAQDQKEIFEILKESFHSDLSVNALSLLKQEALAARMYDDDRLGDTIRHSIDTFFIRDEQDETYVYDVLDMKLCMLKEREEILPQLEILENEYPECYEKIRSFADRLRSGKPLDHLKDSMQKQYAALDKYEEGGRYFKLYPEEKRRSYGKVVYQDEEFRPYVNPHKKIGRNDPCPCGSGKKYKHCCMNKQNA